MFTPLSRAHRNLHLAAANPRPPERIPMAVKIALIIAVIFLLGTILAQNSSSLETVCLTISVVLSLLFGKGAYNHLDDLLKTLKEQAQRIKREAFKQELAMLHFQEQSMEMTELKKCHV